MDLISPLKTIKGIGPTTVKRFQKLGVENIRDLLFYYPFRYDDFSKITLIENLQAGEPATVSGKITLIANRRAKRRRMVITEALLEDKSDVIKITWFNQAFITQNLNVGDQVYISGKPEYYLNSLQFSNPSYEKIKEQTTHTARLIPIYPSTEKLTQKQIRWIIQAGLESANQIDEWLPQNILTKYNLISLPWAITQIHFPDSKEQLHLAEERLKFDELFLIQLKNFYLRQKLAKQISPAINFFESETKKFVASLGFKLTDAQRKCAWQIIADLEKTIPMNRLLEGDVGSGKTVVAGIALLNVILNQQQAVLLAPTEILAQQHYQTFLNLFQSYNFRIALLTRTNQKLNGQEISKKDLLKALAENQVDLVIGTHALLQEKIKFAKLALAIVDEQHRFGVNQRAQIVEQINQTATPHFLSMTATPIPRSLALTIFGDLDLSIIDEMPSNRKKIITKLVDPKNRYQAYHFIANQIKTGRQVFVVCPLIDPSDKLGVKSV
ncbi:MAG: ATP-dependent DNA helicase RecG, partial [Patescibacteria group bacterium]